MLTVYAGFVIALRVMTAAATWQVYDHHLAFLDATDKPYTTITLVQNENTN